MILNHLTRPVKKGEKFTPSVLRRAMSTYFCYTTVFNAIELFSLCEQPSEHSAVENVMYSMKILGLNGKSAKNVAEILRESRKKRNRDLEALVAGVCVESKLPLLTSRPGRYSGIRSLTVMTPEQAGISHRKGT